LADPTGNPFAAHPCNTGNLLPLTLPPARHHPANRHPPPTTQKLARPLLMSGCAIGAPGDGLVSGDTLFGVHGAALEVRSQRMGVLASNIANASTPGFKARDIDFQAALASVENDGSTNAATKYRIPTQTSMDGNTVELSQEQTAFAENAVQYQTTLSFLNGRIGQITRALKGE
jgi:flagellar basal-body rod protein FlgB